MTRREEILSVMVRAEAMVNISQEITMVSISQELIMVNISQRVITVEVMVLSAVTIMAGIVIVASAAKFLTRIRTRRHR